MALSYGACSGHTRGARQLAAVGDRLELRNLRYRRSIAMQLQRNSYDSKQMIWDGDGMAAGTRRETSISWIDLCQQEIKRASS